MSDASNGDNDADKRPHIYGAATEDGVELTVKGAEGETADDISDTFDDKLDKLSDAQAGLVTDNGPTKGCE